MTLYVVDTGILTIFEVTNFFVLPLYERNCLPPTLLFQTAKGQIKSNALITDFVRSNSFSRNVDHKGQFYITLLIFKPFTLNSLFGISAQELTDNPIDLKLLPAKTTAELQERLLNAGSAEEMISLLDDYIYSLVTKVKLDFQLVNFATAQIAKNPAREILIKVQRELYLTERTFQRMFEKNIGMTPNLFRRISQFNSAFQQLTLLTSQPSDIAFEHGYADQSHYIRSFKEFTNITPGTI
jgi:AraC-like DNA-binding protein